MDLLSPGHREGILAGTLLLPALGNHDICATRGRDPVERLDGVTPEDWTTRAFHFVFPLPALPEALGRRRRERHPGCGEADFYAVRMGDVWIASLFGTRAYVKGDYAARTGRAFEPPGRFIFEPIRRGSLQHAWLEERLASPAARNARVRIVLLHHGIFSQGHSAVLPFGDPPEYEEDYLVRDLFPLLKEGGVHLVFNGHNHLVNHHVVEGIHFVESSHLGNTYRPYRRLPDGRWAPEPHGHPARLLISEPGVGFFSVLELEGQGTLTTYRVEDPARTDPWLTEADRTGLGLPAAAT
jgi:hypothetical protein